MAHPLFLPAFLAYPSRRSGRLYTSDVRQRLPGHRATHLHGCHNRPPAGCHAECHRCFPPCPRRRRPPFTDRQSEASVPLAFVGRGGLVLARAGYVPREHPLRWSARPLCTPAPAQALASLGVSVYDPTCPCAGACLRCQWRQPTRVPWPLHSRPGAKPAVRPWFAPPTLVGRSAGQNNPPGPCALHAGHCMPLLMQSKGRLPAEARRAPMPDLAVDTGHQASRRSTTSSVTVRHAGDAASVRRAPRAYVLT